MKVTEHHPQFPVGDIPLKESFNPRSDLGDLSALKDSIQDTGVITDLIVAQIGETGEEFLVCGHRRYHALVELDESFAPVKFVDLETEMDAVCLALTENSGDARTDLSIYDKCIYYKKVMEGYNPDKKINATQVAKLVGTTPVTVRRHLKFLNLPEDAMDMLKRGELSFNAATELVETNQAVQKETTKKLATKVQEKLKEGTDGKKPAKKKPLTASDVKDAAEEAKESEPELTDLPDKRSNALEDGYCGFLAGSVQGERDNKRSMSAMRSRAEKLGFTLLELLDTEEKEIGKALKDISPIAKNYLLALGELSSIVWYFGGPDAGEDGLLDPTTCEHFNHVLEEMDEEFVKRAEQAD